jgi:magnesium transporter
VWQAGVLQKEDFPLDDVSDHVAEDDSLVWVDLCLPGKDELQKIAAELGLDPLAVEDALEHHERPKVDRYPTHIFVTTYAMHCPTGGPLELARVSAFVLPRAFVTVRAEDFDIDPVVKAWDDNPELLEFGSAALLYGLLDVVVDGHLAALQAIDDEVEDAEDRLFDERPRSGHDIQRQTYTLRREMTKVRKVVLPMREVADVLVRHGHPHPLDHDNGMTELGERWRDLRDHVVRTNEWNDSLRDTVTTMFETGLSLADANLNQIVRKLSGWAAIIAVPTAVTGFYGQNVPYPGAGQTSGFVISTVITILLAVGVYAIFKKKSWL